MRISSSFLFGSFLFLLIFSACGEKEPEPDNQPVQTTSRQLEYTKQVTFLNANGEELVTIEAALADEQNERNQGLMEVTDLPANAGMLFIFEEENQLSFYMANTPLPLDIMYVNSDSTIVRIYRNTTPYDNSQLPSGEPAQYVVETNGGFAATHDIQEGMRVRF